MASAAAGSSSSSSAYSNSPCAACKFLRRKCLPDCIFAPYFPPEEPQKFANVHKIFGASNVSKLLNEVLPHPVADPGGGHPGPWPSPFLDPKLLRNEYSLCRIYVVSGTFGAFDRRPLEDAMMVGETQRRPQQQLDVVPSSSSSHAQASSSGVADMEMDVDADDDHLDRPFFDWQEEYYWP